MAAHVAVILLGSNLEPARHLGAAIESLERCGRVTEVSSTWVSPAAGRPELPEFHNVAVALETELGPLELRGALRRIEAALGRVRDGADKFGSRTIDLDIVLYDDLVDPIGPPVLPDPDLLRFAHAIVPVAELDPSRPHPSSHERLGALADRLAPGWRSGPNGRGTGSASPRRWSG